MAIRRTEPSPDGYTEAQIKEWAEGEPDTLRHSEYPVFTPPVTSAGDILFTRRTVDPVAAAVEARRSGLWANPQITDALWPAREDRARPLMPLRRGHMAMLVAAGFLDNLQLEADGQRILVKGRTSKEMILVDDTPEKEVFRERLKTTVVALGLDDGEITDIGRLDGLHKSGRITGPCLPVWGGGGPAVSTFLKGKDTHMNLASFIDTYKDAIAQRVVESFPPLYRPSDAGSVPLPKLLRSPLGRTGRRNSRSSAFPPRQLGDDGRRRDGHGQDVHRHGRRSRRRFQAHPRSRASTPDHQVETGDRADHPRHEGGHRQFHHGHGQPPPPRHVRAVVRHHVPANAPSSPTAGSPLSRIVGRFRAAG